MTELQRHAWDMAAAAEETIETVSVEDMRDSCNEEVILVDIRDVRERWIEGTIPGAKHVPRGMLEFWVDPETDYHRNWFDPDERYILFCNEAGRSALAAKRLREMGFQDVAHMTGGFTAWQAADYEIEEIEQRDYKDR
jgi:rhodanese-related sulfurtransferase